MPTSESLDEELNEAAKVAEEQRKKDAKERLRFEALSQYRIKGSDEEWVKALAGKHPQKTLISVKSGEKKRATDDLGVEDDPTTPEPKTKKRKKDKSKKKKMSI